MSIATSSLMRPLPGRSDDFVSRLAESKKIMEKNGASVTFHSLIAGPEANAMLYVAEVADWDAYAKCAKKMEGDKDWTALYEKSFSDPVNEMISTGILQQFELP
jgi:hypothetical protein